MVKFEIVKKGWLQKKYHFRFVAANGKIICSSAKYYNLKDCNDAIELVKEKAKTAPTEFK
jgi:uncharacterized protein YegP (UPF0339 family)